MRLAALASCLVVARMWLAPVAAADSPPAVLLLDASAVQQAQAAARDGDPGQQPALAIVRDRAEHALADRPVTVTSRRSSAPSGDPHDYVSLSIYWWPDPAAAPGSPYILRDGARNPEADDSSRYDASSLALMLADVDDLALGYYLTGDERFGRHAADLLRVWFLDPETRMNPNMRYAQLIPGRNAIRGTGIIESRGFTRVVDSVGLLGGCACWSYADQVGMQSWFRDLEAWLRTSSNGKMEAQTVNNHAVWYDTQVVDFALFTGDREIARTTAAAAGDRRIATQIAADGSMPRELERTRSLHYTNFNLQAFAELATLGTHAGVDLWSYRSGSDGSLRAAVDLVVPFLNGSQAWPYQEIGSVDAFQESAQTLTRAAIAYPDGHYEDVLAALSEQQSDYALLRLKLGYWPD